MEESSDTYRRGPSRRSFLAAGTVAVGAALAGCSGRSNDADADARIRELESELAAVHEENAKLSERVAELERELAAYRRRLDSLNLWGFEEETMSRLQELAHGWTDSVVAIDAITDDGLWGVGTGWVYEEGVVASNAHVVEPRRLPEDHSITRYVVWDSAGNRVDGKLLGYTYGRDEIFERNEDIGFLEVPESITEGRLMEYGASRELSAEEPLVQIGHPYSLEFWTPSVGPFLGHREPFFASNVPGQPGVSGSPVLDLDGDVVGMTWGGQYIRRQQRQIDEPPRPGDGRVLPAFEEAVNGMHSYMHRIHTAADALI